MKKSAKHILGVLFAWLLVALCAAGIFMLSAQNGEQSAELSGGMMEQFARFMTALFGEAAHNIFRKFAHFFAYCALMFLTYHAVWRTRRLLSPVLPFTLCVLYAVSDEVHQYFVPERACRLFDVFIDTLGCIVGGLCFYLLFRLIRLLKQKFVNRKRGHTP